MSPPTATDFMSNDNEIIHDRSAKDQLLDKEPSGTSDYSSDDEMNKPALFLTKIRKAMVLDEKKVTSAPVLEEEAFHLPEEEVSLQEKCFSDRRQLRLQLYSFIRKGDFDIVWPNVFIFIVGHITYFYSLSLVLSDSDVRTKYTWFWSYWVGVVGGLGITAGAHRLWSHKSYKARLPLRIFLMIGQTIAGQNSLYIWCRDHRVHHKFSETDGDPHNTNRGFFFA